MRSVKIVLMCLDCMYVCPKHHSRAQDLDLQPVLFITLLQIFYLRSTQFSIQ